MKVITIADEIYRELDQPSDLSVNAICYWLRANIGALNTRILTSYTISETGAEISPELDEDEKAIFKKLYMIGYWSQQVRRNLGAAAYDVLELSQDGDTIRTVNKNELSKSYTQMKKIEIEELDKLVQGYKSKIARPRQVVGDDVIYPIINSDDNYIR